MGGIPASRAKKILTAVLIAANVLMLVVGLVTVHPNIRGAEAGIS